MRITWDGRSRANARPMSCSPTWTWPSAPPAWISRWTPGRALRKPSRMRQGWTRFCSTGCSPNAVIISACFAPPGTLDKCYDLAENAIDPLIEIAQASVPFLILDMPHVWNAWARKVLVGADEIIITAVPDLPNLRNAKSLMTFLRQARPHDPPPKLLLNQVGMPKRPEIKPAEFAKAVQLELLACIPFDSHLFGKASNEGQMVAEVSAKAPASKIFNEIAGVIAPHQCAAPKRAVQSRFDDKKDEAQLEEGIVTAVGSRGARTDARKKQGKSRHVRQTKRSRAIDRPSTPVLQRASSVEPGAASTWRSSRQDPTPIVRTNSRIAASTAQRPPAAGWP